MCSTITSDQLVGGQPFKFKDDVRKNAVVIVAENEYKTDETLPPFDDPSAAKERKLADPADSGQALEARKDV